ncbi:hypothetical protein GN316_20300 [Xylophilus sp. Kf1]|nr:hypothetical protein [Xylophilus sp. Kf1]
MRPFATRRHTHLRGQAGQSQVEGVRLALQRKPGLGGACLVSLYHAA